jgi:hypothetical protein
MYEEVTLKLQLPSKERGGSTALSFLFGFVRARMIWLNDLLVV